MSNNNIYTCQKYIKQQKQLEESFMGDYIRLTALGSIVVSIYRKVPNPSDK